MARLFDGYVMVDWSASAVRKTGADSIWVGVLKRDIRFQPTFEAHNPGTRKEAEALLRTILADLRRRSDRALIGFDFPFGYPEGTAEALKLEGGPWAAMWRYISGGLVDKADNTNNRATLAARMNRLMTDAARPFWGAPRAADVSTHLSKTKPAGYAEGFKEFRYAELATKGLGKAGAKPVWQLTGNGSVGSQALTGIPVVQRLRQELGERAVVWPFETGWKALSPADLDSKEAVLVEIYPALVTPRPEPAEVLDRAQVRALCQHFYRLDEAGRLGAQFAPPKGVPEAEVAAVIGEEGWILGAGT